MVSAASLECCVRQSSVCFFCLWSRDLCFMYDVWDVTISLKWTGILVASITVVIDFFRLFRWFVNLGFAVARDNSFYVAHTAVAQRYSVPVEDFVQRVVLREMLIN